MNMFLPESTNHYYMFHFSSATHFEYFTPLLSFPSSIQQWRLKTLAFSGKHLLRVKFLVIVETLGQTYC